MGSADSFLRDFIPAYCKHVYSGKVRDLYEIDEKTLVLVASDRVSAFDWVLPDYIDDKGKVLTQLSKYWFEKLRLIIPNHWMPERETVELPVELAKRAMVVKKAKIFPFEFIVRGYLAGSAWKTYQASGKVGIDHSFGPGLVCGQKFPEPLMTPSTKAKEKGAHDEDVSWWSVEQALGKDKSNHINGVILEIFKTASKHLEEKGIILVDTKFELGEDDEGTILLADEALTPDSSRFWWKRDWEERMSERAKERKSEKTDIELAPMDKQLVRDYLEKVAKWDKKPPIPILPPPLVEKTRAAYLELFHAVTGKEPEL
ncbi:MAG: phosphoribosylaminoimidazolesuccinocarboxamide synthase [Elusimicrobia bacterium]|nr:phosphoribosylaminoimidazolesuccinocarboxamide synthase [Elusimicrobiota bacterium]